MKKLIIGFTLMVSLLLSGMDAVACTSAIFTGKVTADGRPVLWKHRDTGEDNNRVQFFKGDKYNFLGLVNSPDKGGVVWIGTNETGFSIMNTASYNLKDDNVKEMDMEGELMYKALAVCSSLEDFEEFLNNLPRPMRVEANFGVIDAMGGAAYYETNNTKFVKVDANDPAIAPQGYLVYTNFSYTGRFNEGMGYIRQQNALDIISGESMFSQITPRWIFNKLSRSYYHSFMGTDLTSPESSPERFTGWVLDQDYIPRKSSTASVAIHGVKPGENPEMTTMWTVLGYPPAGIAVPMWVKAGEDQPSVMVKSDRSDNAPACDMALALKYKTFSNKRGSGQRYMNFNLIYNSNRTGYMQELAPAENYIETLFKEPIERWRRDGLDVNELVQYYNDANDAVIGAYLSLTAGRQ
ncbi:MAG: hypothetical protein PHV91_04990 [Bacteroidales bacterium]|jgi:hypothetical protein|nr:hypothetical protein [Bacteroidales bacterium]MDD3300166.1 hypothetical protein [Bacteroidales bacterium]MDD3843637.1 hypothetical protein [Bacteroidales bacterium]MDD4618656.1 hypothetical protein [Bacteroidales bacterium]